MAKIFKVVGFSLDKDYHTFKSDGTLNLCPNERIIIDADTELYTNITIQFRARFTGSNLGNTIKTLLTVGNSTGTAVQTAMSPSNQMKELVKVLPAMHVVSKFNPIYFGKYMDDFGQIPNTNWINSTITLNKSKLTYSFKGTKDDGTSLYSYSGSNKTTVDNKRDSSVKWLIGAYMVSSKTNYRHPYNLELDLNSVKVTLDGTEYLLKSPDIEIDKKVVLNNTEGGNLEPYITTDSALNTESTNPIQNGVVANKLKSILYFDTVN